MTPRSGSELQYMLLDCMPVLKVQMASKHTQGAKTRTPKGFQKLLAVNMGFGVDQHGQDATVRSFKTVHAYNRWLFCSKLSLV